MIVLALGKAAGAMARVAEAHYGADATALAVVPHGVDAGARRGSSCSMPAIPFPTRPASRPRERLLALAGGAGATISSSSCSAAAPRRWPACPATGLTLAEKQALTAALLRSGAPIGEINCVRRHVSRIKGGRLPRARLLTLAISDVVGDRPEDIGSGPDRRRSDHGRRRAGDPRPLRPRRAAGRNRRSRWPASSASSPAPRDALAAAAAEARAARLSARPARRMHGRGARGRPGAMPQAARGAAAGHAP